MTMMVRKGFSLVIAVQILNHNAIAGFSCSMSNRQNHKPSISKQIKPYLSLSRQQLLTSKELTTTRAVRTTSESQSQESSTHIKTQQPNTDIERETLSRIVFPSLIMASICYATFPTIASTLTTSIHDAYDGGAAPTYYGAEALNLILNDNSNQFIQNMHNFFALLFSLLTGYTFAFVYRQQEKVYYALFEEVSAATSLLEQMALATEGRSGVYRILLESMLTYVRYDMKMTPPPSITDTDTTTPPPPTNTYSPEETPARLLSTRPSIDPFETILYVTSVGTPSGIYSSVRQLRQSRSTRLAAMQRKMPELNLYLLYILGFMAWLTFPIVAAGSYTVGGDALLNVQRVQLSLGVFAMGGVLGIINELKVPALNGGGSEGALGDSIVRSVYDVDFSVLDTLLNGLENEICTRLEKVVDSSGENILSESVATSSVDNGYSSQNFGISSRSDSGVKVDNADEAIAVNRDIIAANQNQSTDNGKEEVKRKRRIFRRIINRMKNRQN